jgi:hypothetical protein
VESLVLSVSFRKLRACRSAGLAAPRDTGRRADLGAISGRHRRGEAHFVHQGRRLRYPGMSLRAAKAPTAPTTNEALPGRPCWIAFWPFDVRPAVRLALGHRLRCAWSLVATGIAPGSFCELDPDGKRQRAHHDGLPVDFIAEVICTLGEQMVDRFATSASTGRCSGTTGVTAGQAWCFQWRLGVAGGIGQLLIFYRPPVKAANS